MKTATMTRLLAVSFVLLASTAAWTGRVHANQQPAISAPATWRGAEGSPIDCAGATFGATATDPDASDVLTITQTGKPADLTFTTNSPGVSPRTARITGTPGFTDAGNYSIVWTVNDGTGAANATASTTTVLTIANVNSQPTITAPATATGVEGTPIATISATATDPDVCSQALTITQAGKPADLLFTAQAPGLSPRTAQITGTPGFTDAGTYSVVWTVNDGTGTINATASTTTVLTISNTNQQPAITAPATASGSEGVAIATITATATDADATDNLTITQAGKPASLTFTAQAAGPSPRTATISGTPAFGSAGTYSVVWTVNDGTGGSNATASTTTVLTISGSNRQPAISAPATACASEGSPVAPITATAIDADAADVLTITHTGKPADLTFTTNSPGVSPRTAQITGTPGFTDAGSYSIVWTVNDGIATASTTTVLTIANAHQQPAITAPATASGAEGTSIATITATATSADPCAVVLTITQAGKPASLTFTAQAPGPSPRTATITGTPTFTDAGTYSIVWTVNDGSGAFNATASTTTVLTIGGQDQPPAITAPATASGAENIPIATITATATDADAGDVLTITQAGKPAVLTFTTNAPGVSPRTAQIMGTPSFGFAGIYSIVWTVNDGGVFNSTASTTTILTITRGTNRCPVSNPARGFPYSAVVGVPLTFDGTASFDPDGDPLTYAWDFDASDGITVDATGPMPVHTYPAAGTFTVTLTVTDNGNGDPAQICSNSAGTIATIAPACPATVFNGYDVIKLATGKPTWFAFVQPAGGCYSNTDVVSSSFVLKYAGNQIPAEARRTSIGGDRSGDGIEEIRVSFLKTDLRTLFSALPNGHNMVEVAIEANLATGGILHGTTQVDVVSSGSSSTAAATISPNPMNPASTLTFTTTRSGSAKVEMFDIRGRLVRTILDEPSLAAGVHDVRIEGRGRGGESLASGVYFIRGVSADGEFKQTIAILK